MILQIITGESGLDERRRILSSFGRGAVAGRCRLPFARQIPGSELLPPPASGDRPLHPPDIITASY